MGGGVGEVVVDCFWEGHGLGGGGEEGMVDVVVLGLADG